MKTELIKSEEIFKIIEEYEERVSPDYWGTVDCIQSTYFDSVSNKIADYVNSKWNHRPQTDKAVEMLEEMKRWSFKQNATEIDAVIKELKGEAGF